MELAAGFYVVDTDGGIRCREVVKGRGDERVAVVEPIRSRTLKGAQDGLAFAGPGHGILYAPYDGFVWPGASS